MMKPAPDSLRVSLRPGNHARHDPQAAPTGLDHLLHTTRYGWVVAEFARAGHVVADLGCGTGYGTRMLADARCSVVGVDFDPVVSDLNHAGMGHFVCADVTSPLLVEELGRSRFDLIVSMETIEHLEDYVTFLRNCSNLVKDSGVVVIGTPNRSMTYERYPNRRHMDPSHVQEFTPVALQFVAESFFGSVEIVFQEIPDYWTRKMADPTPVRAPSRWRLREWIPPILATGLRKIRQERKSVDHFSVSEKVVRFSSHQEGVDREAFALLAVCRQPLRGSSI